MYGRRTTLSRGAGIRGRNRVNLRRKRPSTKKIYRRLKRSFKRPRAAYAVAKNRVATRQLKTVVNQGTFQRNLQYLSTESGESIEFTQDSNILVPANDFTHHNDHNVNGGIVYINRFQLVDPTDPNSPKKPKAYEFGHWNPLYPALNQNLDDEYIQWGDINQSSANPQGYMPISARYTFNFNWLCIDKDEPPIRLRFDVLKRKRRTLNPVGAQYNQLPECGGALSSMAETPWSNKQNRYNPEMWTVKSKYVYVPRDDVKRANVQKTVTLAIRFPRKRLNLNLKQLSASAYEPFDQKCPTLEQVWINMNISTHSSEETSYPEVSAQRQICFRDHKPGKSSHPM